MRLKGKKAGLSGGRAPFCGIHARHGCKSCATAQLRSSRSAPACAPLRGPNRGGICGPGAAAVRKGSWERTISISRTIVSYVVVARGWLPAPIGGVCWLGFHAAHTSFYVPFPVGMAEANTALPKSHTTNSHDAVGRGVAAWQGARFVFNTAQLRFDLMVEDIVAAQALWHSKGVALMAGLEKGFLAGKLGMRQIAEQVGAHAMANTEAWWLLADQLMLRYADGYCNSCGRGPRHLGYPAWWLRSKAVGYEKGPPPSLPVPPPPVSARPGA